MNFDFFGVLNHYVMLNAYSNDYFAMVKILKWQLPPDFRFLLNTSGFNCSGFRLKGLNEFSFIESFR